MSINKLSGLKAQAKLFLKQKGITSITTPQGGVLRFGNAKTRDVVSLAIKYGFKVKSINLL